MGGRRWRQVLGRHALLLHHLHLFGVADVVDELLVLAAPVHLLLFLQHGQVRTQDLFNPFTAPECKVSALRSARTCLHADSIFSGPVTSMILIVRVWVKILSRTTAKEKREKAKGF